MGPSERVHDLVAPLLAPLGLELFDVELIGAVLRIAVPLALLASAIFGAGWKWEHFPH